MKSKNGCRKTVPVRLQIGTSATELRNFPVTGQVVNILGFVGHTVFVATIPSGHEV